MWGDRYAIEKRSVGDYPVSKWEIPLLGFISEWFGNEKSGNAVECPSLLGFAGGRGDADEFPAALRSLVSPRNEPPRYLNVAR